MNRNGRIPALPRDHVSRQHLVARVGERPITLVSAPAGYGKSLLLAEACHSLPVRPAWYTLVKDSPAPGQIMQDLARAMGAPAQVSGDLATLGAWARSSPCPWLLVVDGTERAAGNAAVWQIMEGLVQLATPQFRVALAGRNSRQALASLPRRRLAGDVTELGTVDLCFSADDETVWLAHQTGTEPDRSLVALAEGWPAALGLLRSGANPDWRALYTYMESEIWPYLDGVDRSRLTDLAVVSDWDGQAYNWFFDQTDGMARFAQWAEVLPLNRNGRLHPLVCRFLLDQLINEPERQRALHRRAARYEAERGAKEPALVHAMTGEDLGFAVPLLRQVGARLLANGRLSELEEWLERSPDGVLDRVPELLLAAGELWRRSGQLERAVYWLRYAAVGFARAEDGQGILRAFCQLAVTHADLGEWSEAEAAIKQVESEMASATGLARAEALRALAAYQLHQGQPELAAQSLEEAADLALALGDPDGAGTALTALGSGALVVLGQIDQGLERLREAQALLTGPAAVEALLAEADLLMDQGRWAEADVALAQVDPATEAQQALHRWARARLAVCQGDLAAATSLSEGLPLQAAMGGAQQVSGTWFQGSGEEATALLEGYAALTAACLALATGDRAEALTLGRQANRAASRSSPLLRRAVRRFLVAWEQLRGSPSSSPAPVRSAPEQVMPTPTTISSAPFPSQPTHGPKPAPLEEGAVSIPADEGLWVEALGPFRIRCRGVEVPLGHWGRAQVRALFQFLLLQPGFSTPREVLLELLWPEASPTDSRARLRVALNRLRQALQALGLTVETGPDTVRLPDKTIAWFDLRAFREHLQAARRLFKSDPSVAARVCREARGLYRGHLFADSFWPWMEEHRQRGERELRELLQLWSEAAELAGLADEAVMALEELLALDPGAEEAARRLISLLIQGGRRAEAIHCYRSLVRWMKGELGLEPSSATKALVRQALE